MSLVIKESNKSRSFNITRTGADLVLEYFVYRTYDEDEVFSTVASTAPTVANGLVRGSINPENLGGGFWRAEVTYASPGRDGGGTGNTPAGGSPTAISTPSDSSEMGDPAGTGIGFDIDISGHETHITQSLQTMAVIPAPGEQAIDFKRAIGVTTNGVAGCTIITPKVSFNWQVERASIKLPYIRVLRDLVGTTNDGARWGFGDRELLYLGASGRPVGDGLVPKYSVNHKFAVGKTINNLNMGNGIIVPIKRAWEYLWCFYKEKDVGGIVLPVPVAAYIEKVYEETNWAGLEIG